MVGVSEGHTMVSGPRGAYTISIECKSVVWLCSGRRQNQRHNLKWKKIDYVGKKITFEEPNILPNLGYIRITSKTLWGTNTLQNDKVVSCRLHEWHRRWLVNVFAKTAILFAKFACPTFHTGCFHACFRSPTSFVKDHLPLFVPINWIGGRDNAELCPTFGAWIVRWRLLD